MLNDAPRRASRPTASRNYTPRAHPMFSIARAAAAARDASESGRDAGIVCRRAAIVRATSGCCIRRPVPRDRSRAPIASPRTVFGDGPASRFANLRSGSRHPRRAQSGDRFFIPRRARNRSWVPGFRIPVDVLARTSSRGRRRRRRRREARRGSGRRERDASATRARRERDANRREPTTVRAAAIERRGATEARARRFAFDLESRRSFASTREFRRVEGANADDARARDVG
jgi:hypothetical protein